MPDVPTSGIYLPYVHYMPDRYFEGADDLGSNAPTQRKGEFEEVFKKHHETDAHFVTYQIVGEDVPRLNKPALHHIRAHGADIVTTMLVFDWDTEGHIPLTLDTYWAMLQKLQAVAVEWPIAMKWNLLYTTRNGLRFIYLLDQKVPADKSECHHRWMWQEFQNHGINLDPLSDWTRWFRLPFVTRDKKPTWQDDNPPIQYIPLGFVPLPVAELGSVGRATMGNQYAEIVPVTNPKPDPDITWKMLYLSKSNGTNVPNEFYKIAKKALRGRECYPCIFELASLAPVGRRNDTIHRFVGQAIGMLYNIEGTQPEHIYALFIDSVAQLQPDEHTHDWSEVLWSSVVRLWALEAAKVKQKEIDQEAKAVNSCDLGSSIINGMRNWCPAPELRDIKQSLDYVTRHAIISVAPSYFVMRPDGTYDPTPLTERQVIAAIRSRGMENLINTKQQNEQGVYVDRTVASVLGEYSTIASEVWATPGEGGATVKDLDTPQAQVILPCFCRNTSLEPLYSWDVDQWLKRFFGPHYGIGIKWVAYALAFDEGPICALSIMGKAGSGKKMLVQGLSECLRLPRLATSEDLLGDYNDDLLKSPFLSVDEGWVKAGKGRHPADQFRSLVAGDGFTVKKKYLAPIHITNSVRVIFTANNLDVIRVLTQRRELSPEDREALSQRLLHCNIDDQASTWLAEVGGIKFTGKPGQRWIRGDGGEESDFVVAKHFLWLYQQRRQLGEAGGRFLVEGNAAEEIMSELRTGAGSSPMVIESLLNMLEKSQKFEGMAVVDDRLYVSSSEVLTYYRNNMSKHGGGRMTSDQVHNALKGISIGDEKKRHLLPTREQMGPRTWIEIDCRILLEVAQRDAWKCDKLAELVQRQGGVAGVLKPEMIGNKTLDNGAAIA